MCNANAVSMGKYAFKLHLVKPWLEMSMPNISCHYINFMFYSTMQRRNPLCETSIITFWKGSDVFFRPRLLPAAQIQSPFLSYRLCFQHDESARVESLEMAESNSTTKRWKETFRVLILLEKINLSSFKKANFSNSTFKQFSIDYLMVRREKIIPGKHETEDPEEKSKGCSVLHREPFRTWHDSAKNPLCYPSAFKSGHAAKSHKRTQVNNWI